MWLRENNKFCPAFSPAQFCYFTVSHLPRGQCLGSVSSQIWSGHRRTSHLYRVHACRVRGNRIWTSSKVMEASFGTGAREVLRREEMAACCVGNTYPFRVHYIVSAFNLQLEKASSPGRKCAARSCLTFMPPFISVHFDLRVRRGNICSEGRNSSISNMNRVT